MTDIKPVAWKKRITANDYYLFHGERPSGEGYTPLYPESALLQAREEGRREGMREAAEISDKLHEGTIDRGEHKTDNYVYSEDVSAAITRAAEGK